jgi:hypothetical protein
MASSREVPELRKHLPDALINSIGEEKAKVKKKVGERIIAPVRLSF